MNKTWLLVKAYVSGASFLSKGQLEDLKQKKRLWIIILVVLGIGSALVSLGGLLLQNYIQLYRLGAQFGSPHFLILMALFMSWIIVLVFSFTSAMSILYRSRDIMVLVPLPVTPLNIVLSRMVILYIYAMPFFLIFLLPAYGVFGHYYGWSLRLVFSMIVVCLTGQIIPLLLSALAASLLVRAAAQSKYRTIFEVIGMILLLTVIILLQAMLTRMSVEDPTAESQIYRYLADRIDRFFSDFIVINWAAIGVMPGQTAKTLLFGAVTLAAAWPLSLAVTSRYHLLISREAASVQPPVKRRRAGKDGVQWLQRGVYRTLVRREWDIISSNSTYIMESFMQLLILPILIVVMGISGTIGELGHIRDAVFEFPLFELILFGILLLMTVLTSVPASSISREGSLFTLSRVIPVSGVTQVKAKLAFIILFYYPAFIVYYIILTTVFPADATHMIYALPGGLVFLCMSASVGLLIDLHWPLLNWTHPQQAMKQNLNVLIAMGINTLILAVFALGVFLLDRLGAGGVLIGIIIVTAAAALLAGVVFRLLRKAAEMCYEPQ